MDLDNKTYSQLLANLKHSIAIESNQQTYAQQMMFSKQRTIKSPINQVTSQPQAIVCNPMTEQIINKQSQYNRSNQT